MSLSASRFRLNRRAFLNAAAALAPALWSALPAGKAEAIPDYRNDKNIPADLLQNRDVPGFHIRSANPFPGVNVAEWSLQIGGLVKNKLTLAYEDLFRFKTITQISRLKCVECWSAKAKWEGFRIEDLMALADASPQAEFVNMLSADSYYESFYLEELRRPRTLLVLRMNGQPLSRDHGFPLRLIIPYKYGYKNIKYIKHIEFSNQRTRNYWADNGPYSLDGSIQPGIDHPLDYNKKPLPINGGEVFHPFDERPPP